MLTPYGLMADLHLHPWSAFANDVDGLNSRLVGLLSEIQRCAAEVAAAGGKRIYVAGDVFHVRGSVSPTVQNSTKDTLQKCHDDHGVEFWILPGNHDLEGRNTTRLCSAVTALEAPHVIQVHGPSIDRSHCIVMVPWFENVATLKQEIQLLQDQLLDCNDMIGDFDLMLHAPIDGVIEGLPMHGLDPTYLAGLGFKRVFAGHYHNHKTFPGGVHSIGALAHHTWSDVDSRAGYLLVDDTAVNWRKSHLPQFIDLGKAAVRYEPEELPMVVDGNYVRVKVSAAQSKQIEEARQELLDMGAKAVLVQVEPTAPVRDNTTQATVAAGASLEASVADFVKGMANVSVEEVTRAALSVLSSVEEK